MKSKQQFNVGSTVNLGLPLITQPSLFGTVVKETPKTFEVEITKLDFTPKTGRSGRLTHKFDKDERAHLTDVFIGQRRKFWKTGSEFGGGTMFLMEVRNAKQA